MKADLHLHSIYSDAADTIEQLCRLSVERNLTHISIVDHDMTMHIPESIEMAKKYNLQFIPGIEISAFDFKRNRPVHIFGYGIEAKSEHILGLCNPLQERRHAHGMWQAKKIIEAGYSLHLEEALSYAKTSGILFKQHIMRAITTAHPDTAEYKQLYKELFGNGGLVSEDIEYVDAFEAVKAIKADGGLVVVAHPGQLDSYELIEELVALGLDGIDLIHPDHDEIDHAKVRALAEKYNLFMTGGSDYHGVYSHAMDLETYCINEVPQQLLEKVVK